MEFVDQGPRPTAEEVLPLYSSVGWTAYTKERDGLATAVENSTYLAVCREDDRLVGLIRSMSDGYAVNYVQDILVHPDYQGKGVGRRLMKMCLEHFKHIRSHVLLTDDDEQQLKFYKSMGFLNTRELKKTRLNAFVKMKDYELE